MKISHCDLTTGKIYGCKLGSNRWWHEKGHFKFNELESTSRLKLFQSYIFIVWMFSVTLSFLNEWMLIVSLPMFLFYFGIDLYEEWWCNEYAEMMFGY